jgi:hypothetical protein
MTSGPNSIEKSFCKAVRRIFTTSVVTVQPIPGRMAGFEVNNRIIVGAVMVVLAFCGNGSFSNTSCGLLAGWTACKLSKTVLSISGHYNVHILYSTVKFRKYLFDISYLVTSLYAAVRLLLFSLIL